MMLNSILLDYKNKINSRLDILLPLSGQLYDSVVTAARYSILDSGKRIRPIILLEFYRLCGGNDDCAYHFAAALEMIHTYSLIHDDLPCMDDDDMRRGRPSCHKQFDEATALLAGDALLTEAFSTAAKTAGIPCDRVVRALSALSSCAGVNGMIGGQLIDLESEGKTVSVSTVNEMCRLKTGALIKAASTIGCILAGADDEKISSAALYAEKVGVAFQIVDDILDHEGDEATLGKPVGSDDKNSKNTFVSLLGIDECRKLASQLTDEALEILDSFDGDSAVLKELTKYLLCRNS